MPAELEHLFFSSLSSTQYFPVIFLFSFFFSLQALAGKMLRTPQINIIITPSHLI